MHRIHVDNSWTIMVFHAHSTSGNIQHSTTQKQWNRITGKWLLSSYLILPLINTMETQFQNNKQILFVHIITFISRCDNINEPSHQKRKMINQFNMTICLTKPFILMTLTKMYGTLHIKPLHPNTTNTVDHVHFECWFVKPLWSIITQAKGLTDNALTPQTQHPFLQPTLFHPPLRRKKDTWFDMAHSVVHHQAWVCDGWCAITSSPKPFPFLNDLLNVLIWHHMPSPTNWLTFQQHTVYDTHMTVPQPLRTGGFADVDNCWRNTPSHSPPHHPTLKHLPLSPLFQPSRNTPCLGVIAWHPLSIFLETVWLAQCWMVHWYKFISLFANWTSPFPRFFVAFWSFSSG